MNDRSFRISGPHSEVVAIHDALADDSSRDVRVTPIETKPVSPLDTPLMGIEPVEYFFIVFSAHLAADFVKDWIKSRITTRIEKTNIKVKEDSDSDTSDKD